MAAPFLEARGDDPTAGRPRRLARSPCGCGRSWARLFEFLEHPRCACFTIRPVLRAAMKSTWPPGGGRGGCACLRRSWRCPSAGPRTYHDCPPCLRRGADELHGLREHPREAAAAVVEPAFAGAERVHEELLPVHLEGVTDVPHEDEPEDNLLVCQGAALARLPNENAVHHDVAQPPARPHPSTGAGPWRLPTIGRQNPGCPGRRFALMRSFSAAIAHDPVPSACTPSYVFFFPGGGSPITARLPVAVKLE